jgi:hypothetical protein
LEPGILAPRVGVNQSEAFRGKNWTFDLTPMSGVLESYPFAYASRGNLNNPNGLLVELLQAYFQVLRINYEWTPVGYDLLIDALESRTVDLITGFILESAQRRVRAHFTPLPMPFCLGINAISSSPHIQGDLQYLDFCDIILKASQNSAKKFNLVTIADEIADDYLPLILPDSIVSIRESGRKVADAISYYTLEAADKEMNVVFADQMTCSASLRSGSHNLLKEPIGAFRGGFLLPVYDTEWSSFIEGSLYSMLSAKLPKVGIIFDKYHNHLTPFIPKQDQFLKTSSHGIIKPPGGSLDGFWSLEEWLSTFWPPALPIPKQLQALRDHGLPSDPANAPSSPYQLKLP